MTAIINLAEMRMRCPRCAAASIVQTAIDLRPGCQYLTLRCIRCAIVFDTQVQLHKAKNYPHEVA
jgi:transcription elongation factor Elf1